MEFLEEEFPGLNFPEDVYVHGLPFKLRGWNGHYRINTQGVEYDGNNNVRATLYYDLVNNFYLGIFEVKRTRLVRRPKGNQWQLQIFPEYSSWAHNEGTMITFSTKSKLLGKWKGGQYEIMVTVNNNFTTWWYSNSGIVKVFFKFIVIFLIFFALFKLIFFNFN